jgi:hypothetical protein
MTNIPALVEKLSEAEKLAFCGSEMLVDGRVLVPSYSVPDQYTTGYSVQRSALNRVGLAIREYLLAQVDHAPFVQGVE